MAFFCYLCNCSLSSPSSLNHHLAQSSAHNYCFACSRDFLHPNALRNHLASSKHQPKDIKCFRCTSTFVTASALMKHIEASKCINVSNKQIVEAVRAWETTSGNQNLLTIPRIGWHDPSSSSMERVQYQATEASFDGEEYVCYICSKGFRALGSLNQHLNSNVHEPNEFRCKKCEMQFKVISSLIQHVESEVCGAMKAKHIKQIAIETHRFTTLSISY